MATYGDPFWYISQQAHRITAMKKTLQAPDPIALIKKQQEELRDVEASLGIDQLSYEDEWVSSTSDKVEVLWKPKYVSKYASIPKKVEKDPLNEKQYYGDIVEELGPLAEELYKMYNIAPYATYPSVELDADDPPKKKHAAPHKKEEVEVPASESGKFGRVVDLD
jgi:hypothetical protein